MIAFTCLKTHELGTSLMIFGDGLQQNEKIGLFNLFNNSMDNNSALESGSSVSETNERYEENEVVWAKIQGYPWWPAYVGQVQAEQDDEVIYKVFFFGDNSHSCLNPQKIRKFQEFFSTFALYSKKNNRLKQALAIAQQQLSDNKEDVSYFDFNSPERKRSELINQSSRKSCSQVGENGKRELEQEQQRNSQLPVKRGRGRPRKNHHPAKDQTRLIQKIQCQGEPQVSVLNHNNHNHNNNIIHELQIKEDHKQLKAKPAKQVEEQDSEEEIIIKRPPRRICKQILRAKTLVSRGSYKEALNLMIDFKVDTQNVQDLLDSKIINKLSRKVSFRSFLKLKEIVKKALIDRYFKNKLPNYAFHQRDKHSLRGKAVRKIYTYLQKSDHLHSKRLAINLEEKIRAKSQNSNDLYMKEIVNLIRNTNAKSFIEKMVQQQKLC